MSTTLVIIGLLIYAGPCALFWYLGKRAGYSDGFRDGREEGHRDCNWGIPNPGDGYER